MIRLKLLASCLVVLAASAVAQPPELIWYDFNINDATNTAAPGVGNGTVDPSLTFSAALCGNDQACVSPAQAATTQIDTGWVTNLGTGDWSIGMHLDLTIGGGFSNYFQYLFGDSTASAFRCFVDGAAGNGNIILRGPVTDTIIGGGGSQTAPVHVCWVYDSTVPEIRGYLNGVLNVTVAQPALNIVGTANFTVMRYSGSTSSARPGVIMDDFRLYSRAIDATGIGPGSELDNWVNFCSSGPPPAPTYQVNQPASSFDIDGLQGGAYGETISSYCAFTPGTANVASTVVGGSYNLVIGVGNSLPGAGGGAITFPDGQIFNANLVGAVTLSGGPLGSLIPYPGNFSVPFTTPPAGFTVHAQPYHTDPASPIGFSMGQCSTLDSLATANVSLNLGDDDSRQITPGGSPLCYSSPLLFYGVSYTDFYVNSNGSVSFSGGDTNFTASPASFATGVPRIAGMWSDLNPTLGGTITVSSSPLGITVSFLNVPEFGVAGNTNSFDILMEPSGQVTISNYLPSPNHTIASLIGISPGTNATDPGSVNFLSLQGGALQGNATTDMVYEYQTPGAVASGWGGIVWPSGDSTAWFVY